MTKKHWQLGKENIAWPVTYLKLSLWWNAKDDRGLETCHWSYVVCFIQSFSALHLDSFPKLWLFSHHIFKKREFEQWLIFNVPAIECNQTVKQLQAYVLFFLLYPISPMYFNVFLSESWKLKTQLASVT